MLSVSGCCSCAICEIHFVSVFRLSVSSTCCSAQADSCFLKVGDFVQMAPVLYTISICSDGLIPCLEECDNLVVIPFWLPWHVEVRVNHIGHWDPRFEIRDVML